MTLHEVTPPPLKLEDVKGTIWESLTALKGSEQVHPFALDSPGQDEPDTLAPGEVRRLTYRASGQLLLYNLDVPAGVTLALLLDGAPKRFSHGNEAGVLRWDAGKSPYRFTSTLEIIVTNTTASAQAYRIHVSGV